MLEFERPRRDDRTENSHSHARVNRFRPSLPISIPIPRNHTTHSRPSPVRCEPQADFIFDLSPEAPTVAEPPAQCYADYHDRLYEIPSAPDFRPKVKVTTTPSRSGRTVPIFHADEDQAHATAQISDASNANASTVSETQDLFLYTFPTLASRYTKSSDIKIKHPDHRTATNRPAEESPFPSWTTTGCPLKPTLPSQPKQDQQLTLPSTSIEKTVSTVSSRSSSYSPFFSNRENGSSAVKHPVVSASITSVLSHSSSAAGEDVAAFASGHSKQRLKFPLIDVKA